jgi:DNA replication protein DnaC
VNAPTVTPELRAVLRRVKLGRCLDTLPERLALATTGGLGHAEFLELVLADEVTRRETTSADRRARTAGLDPNMTLDRWDDTAKITYDHAIWNELCSLRFVDSGHNAVIMGPVGVGKTFLATALGHAAIRRRYSVHFERCDRLLKRLRASRLDNSHDVEMRKLLRVDLLIIDDFALQPLDSLDTADVYELMSNVTAPLRRSSPRTANPSSGSPTWPTRSSRNPRSTGSNPPPTNSSSTASPTGNAKSPASHPPTTRLTRHPRRRDHPAADVDTPTKWSHATDAQVVPSSWRTTASRSIMCG